MDPVDGEVYVDSQDVHLIARLLHLDGRPTAALVAEGSLVLAGVIEIHPAAQAAGAIDLLVEADEIVLLETAAIETPDGIDARSQSHGACGQGLYTWTGDVGTRGGDVTLRAERIVLAGAIALGNGGRGGDVEVLACDHTDIDVRGGDGARSGRLVLESDTVVGAPYLLKGVGGAGGDGVISRQAPGEDPDDDQQGEDGENLTDPEGGDAHAQGQDAMDTTPGRRGGHAKATGGRGALGAVQGGHGGDAFAAGGNGSRGADAVYPELPTPGGHGGNAGASGGPAGTGPVGGNGGTAVARSGSGGDGGWSLHGELNRSGTGADGGRAGNAGASGGGGGYGPANGGGAGGEALAVSGNPGAGGTSTGLGGYGGHGGVFSGVKAYGGIGGASDSGTGGAGGVARAIGGEGGRGGDAVAVPGSGSEERGLNAEGGAGGRGFNGGPGGGAAAYGHMEGPDGKRIAPPQPARLPSNSTTELPGPSRAPTGEDASSPQMAAILALVAIGLAARRRHVERRT